ncbi:hypothetical protein BpHYR1_023913 [Brachionus plicatilis]|uniref:Uncharacterized protein n=1 Tax=Brachionus plicatilis TaxID=10195 RepID=A0A3M7R5G1_BRAPC|nr:hypothetical protein BpHYR1_023913 [Brachionus plicatilis]
MQRFFFLMDPIKKNSHDQLNDVFYSEIALSRVDIIFFYLFISMNAFKAIIKIKKTKISV